MTHRVLVTGGAGFIGSAVVRHIVEATDWQVLTFDKLTYAGHLENLGNAMADPRHQFVQGDITSRADVVDSFSSFKPTRVIHLAAESHVDRSIEGPVSFIDTNIIGTYNLLETGLAYWRELDEAGKAEWRFLHVSTDEVYGSLGKTGLFSETSRYQPNSPYSASKAASDHLVRAWHETYDFPALTSNCSNNYGPYQFPEKLIPLMISNALNGVSLPVYGRGDQIRDWLYVEDHVDALLTILDQGQLGNTYCVGGSCEMTNIDVVNMICELLDDLRPQSPHRPHASLIRSVTDRPGHDKRYAIDTAKIQTEFEWQPRENFRSGLKKTVEWYLDNQDWCATVLSNASRDRNEK
jgi:dTDP-glucose 4,6-dehydratase